MLPTTDRTSAKLGMEVMIQHNDVQAEKKTVIFEKADVICYPGEKKLIVNYFSFSLHIGTFVVLTKLNQEFDECNVSQVFYNFLSNYKILRKISGTTIAPYVFFSFLHSDNIT